MPEVPDPTALQLAPAPTASQSIGKQPVASQLVPLLSAYGMHFSPIGQSCSNTSHGIGFTSGSPVHDGSAQSSTSVPSGQVSVPSGSSHVPSPTVGHVSPAPVDDDEPGSGGGALVVESPGGSSPLEPGALPVDTPPSSSSGTGGGSGICPSEDSTDPGPEPDPSAGGPI